MHVKPATLVGDSHFLGQIEAKHLGSNSSRNPTGAVALSLSHANSMRLRMARAGRVSIGQGTEFQNEPEVPKTQGVVRDPGILTAALGGPAPTASHAPIKGRAPGAPLAYSVIFQLPSKSVKVVQVKWSKPEPSGETTTAVWNV